MQNLGKKLEIFVIISIISVIGIVYAFKQKPVSAPSADLKQEQKEQTGQVTVIEYQGVEGKTALELLKAFHQVEAKHYDFGDLVISIDGITPDQNHFWAMYVNGQFSQVGASAYNTKSNDLIKWQIEEIKSQ